MKCIAVQTDVTQCSNVAAGEENVQNAVRAFQPRKGGFSSTAFSAHCRVVTDSGGKPVRDTCSIHRSKSPSNTAYLCVAVNDPWSSSASTFSANRISDRSRGL